MFVYARTSHGLCATRVRNARRLTADGEKTNTLGRTKSFGKKKWQHIDRTIYLLINLLIMCVVRARFRHQRCRSSGNIFFDCLETPKRRERRKEKEKNKKRRLDATENGTRAALGGRGKSRRTQSGGRGEGEDLIAPTQRLSYVESIWYRKNCTLVS